MKTTKKETAAKKTVRKTTGRTAKSVKAAATRVVASKVRHVVTRKKPVARRAVSRPAAAARPVAAIPQSAEAIFEAATPVRRERKIMSMTLAVAGAAVLMVTGVTVTGSASRQAKPSPKSVPSLTAPASAETAPVEAVVPVKPASASGPRTHNSDAGTIRKVGVAIPQVEAIDTSWASEIIRGRMSQIESLYQRILNRTPDATGTVAVHMDVEPNGYVGRAWVEKSSFEDPQFGHDVLRELISIRYGATGLQGPVGVIVSMAFDQACARLVDVAAHNAPMPGDGIPRVAGVEQIDGFRAS